MCSTHSLYRPQTTNLKLRDRPTLKNEITCVYVYLGKLDAILERWDMHPARIVGLGSFCQSLTLTVFLPKVKVTQCGVIMEILFPCLQYTYVLTYRNRLVGS